MRPVIIQIKDAAIRPMIYLMYLGILRQVKCLQKAIRRKNKLIKRLRKQLEKDAK